MIPINRRYIYHFTKEDFEKYPDEKIHTGMFWKEEKLHEFFLYYNDKPIIRAKKYFRAHQTSNTISSKTFIDVFDMEGNLLTTKEVKIIYSHNRPEDELPQIENLDCIKSVIRGERLDHLLG